MDMDLIPKHLFMEVFSMSIRKRFFILVKLVLFITITVVIVGRVNELLKPKYYYTENWPTTNTYMDFYQLEKNSVDVLMLGSSHAVTTLNPQIIYDNYGITSYNLGCEQQSPLITYYWLREALKYQSPKVVILDTYTFHKYTDGYIYNGMNCSEGAVRKAMDSMRLSPLKVEAALNIERYDESQNGLSFLFLNIRYHARWTGLGENDFTENKMIAHGGIKGFSALGGTNPNSQYTPFKTEDAENIEPEEFVDIAKEYIDKTIELCKQKGIKLILINIPCGEPIARYKATKNYADMREVPYLDFNEQALYNAISYNASENLLSHPNYLGAEKISNYMGEILSSQYNIPKRKDASYDISRDAYEHRIQNIKLKETTDMNQYFDMLHNPSYSLFVFAPKLYSEFLNDDLMEKIHSLGFKTDLQRTEVGDHYYAVKDISGVIEKLTKSDVDFNGSIRDGAVIYSCTINTKAMIEKGYTYSLKIGGAECGNSNAGINIVVYDNDFKCIIDKININTSIEELTISRY